MKKQLSSLYLPVKLKQELLKEAKEKGLSLNSYITMIIMERKK